MENRLELGKGNRLGKFYESISDEQLNYNKHLLNRIALSEVKDGK